MPKLAIFDLDGTMCDTLTDIYDSLHHVFSQNSIEPPSIVEAQTLMGDGLKAFLNKATKIRGNFDCPPSIIDEFVDRYKNNCTIKTTLYDGISELLPNLEEHGIKCAVLSNKSELLVKLILEYFNLTDKFLLISGGDTFAEKKPSPLPLLETLKITGYNKHEAIMIGDSENDVSSGFSAGVQTCYCSYGYGKDLQTKPSYIVDRPAQILDILLEIK